jgi:hypothetical protein
LISRVVDSFRFLSQCSVEKQKSSKSKHQLVMDDFAAGSLVWVETVQGFQRGVIEKQLGPSEYRVNIDGESVDVLQRNTFVRNENESIRRQGKLYELRAPCPAELLSALEWREKERHGASLRRFVSPCKEY